jgi:hypothetical protein
MRRKLPATLVGFFSILLAPLSAAASEKPKIGGVFELGIGTTDALPMIQYWQQFGYRVGETGELTEDQALQLYGVSSRVRSIRLRHQDEDHGLIRLMEWRQPLGDGLGLTPMKALGNRWGAMVTRDVYSILNHAEDAEQLGLPVLFVEPQRQEIYPLGGDRRPFLDPVACVREMLLIQPLTRQILFQRYGYELPLYGRIAEDSPMRTSPVTHAGLVHQGGRELLDFYDGVLGLLRARDSGHASTYDDGAARNIFALKPGESYTSVDFDDPRSVPTDLQRVRSGRLKIIRFPEGVEMPDLRQRSRPGYLGLTLYTYRVLELDEVRSRVVQSDASELTPVVVNEFGERSFSFVAPDGYFWTLVE